MRLRISCANKKFGYEKPSGWERRSSMTTSKRGAQTACVLASLVCGGNADTFSFGVQIQN
jgi:hypothetical protein